MVAPTLPAPTIATRRVPRALLSDVTETGSEVTPHRRLRRGPAAGGPRSRSGPFTGRSPRVRWTAGLTSVWGGHARAEHPSPTHRRSRPDDHDRRRTRSAELGRPGPRRP